MTKKILSVVTTAAVLGTMACASAVSASALSGEFTFEIPDNWASANKVFYAHIWDGLPGGKNLYKWQTKDEKMKVADDKKTATYNVPEGSWNLIIISGDSGIQTYDTVFNDKCIGDTCYIMDDKFENPVDSNKQAFGLGWRNNSDCGPHKVVSSLGNVIGTAFLPGETNQTLYENFLRSYNPENETDADNGIYNWDDDGAAATGMSWEEVTAKVAKELGVENTAGDNSSSDNSSSDNSSSDNSSSDNSSSDNSSSDNSSSDNSSSDNSSSDNSSSGSSGSGSSGSGSSGSGASTSSNSSSSSSSSSTGTTQTGDSTPVVALLATLVAALGASFVALKKKAE